MSSVMPQRVGDVIRLRLVQHLIAHVGEQEALLVGGVRLIGLDDIPIFRHYRHADHVLHAGELVRTQQRGADRWHFAMPVIVAIAKLRGLGSTASDRGKLRRTVPASGMGSRTSSPDRGHGFLQGSRTGTSAKDRGPGSLRVRDGRWPDHVKTGLAHDDRGSRSHHASLPCGSTLSPFPADATIRCHSARETKRAGISRSAGRTTVSWSSSSSPTTG